MLQIGTWNIGSVSGRGGEVCVELRRRRIDECCLQEVRWRAQGARMLWMGGRGFKLWWSGNEGSVVGDMMKEGQCEVVLEV